MYNQEIIKKIMKIKYKHPDKSMVILASHDVIDRLEKDGLATYEREMIYGYHYTICGLPAKEIKDYNKVYVAYDLRFYD